MPDQPRIHKVPQTTHVITLVQPMDKRSQIESFASSKGVLIETLASRKGGYEKNESSFNVI